MPLPLPASIILAAASILLIFGRGRSVVSVRVIGLGSLISLLLASLCLMNERTISFPSSDTPLLPQQVWGSDPLARAEVWLVLFFAILAGASIFDSIRRKEQAPVALGFFLFLIAGMLLCVQANDLLSLGLSFEIIDLAGQALHGRTAGEVSPVDDQDDSKSVAFIDRLTWMVRAWMWLGIAVFANAVSNTNFDVIRRILANAYTSSENPLHVGSPSKMLLIAAGFILISLFVRLIASGLQSRVRTDTEGRATSLPAILAIGQQLVVTSVLVRLVGTVFTGLSHSLVTLLMAMTFVTLAASCLFVFRGQTPGAKSLPRMVSALGLLQTAWFMISLIIAATELDNSEVRLGTFHKQNETLAVIVLIQCSWMLAALALLGVLARFQRANRELQFIEDLKGMGAHSPIAALILLVAVGTLIGFPLSAGFSTRWLTFLAGSNVHWKSASMILTPFEGLRLTMFMGIIATIMNAVLAVNLIRQMFLETPLGRPSVVGGQLSFVASISAAALCVLIGVAPQSVLNPLGSLHPPAPVHLDGPQSGAGSTPMSMRADECPIGRASQFANE